MSQKPGGKMSLEIRERIMHVVLASLRKYTMAICYQGLQNQHIHKLGLPGEYFLLI